MVLLFQNCGDDEAGSQSAQSVSVTEKANFQWIDENIIQPTCVECHGANIAFSGLRFDSYVGVMDAIVPGEPNRSSFYTRSFSTKFFSLTEEEREIIRVWILNGAEF